jgi:hypothetical protein
MAGRIDRSLSTSSSTLRSTKELGGILPFLRRYLFEYLTVGYAAAPLELEAIAIAARVCAG